MVYSCYLIMLKNEKILCFKDKHAILSGDYSHTGVRCYGLVKRKAGENPERCRHCVPERRGNTLGNREGRVLR